MLHYTVRRVLLFVPTILLTTILVFALFWIVPGDAAMMILTGDDADGGRVGIEELEILRHDLRLDRPIHIQYADWLWKTLRGDLGTSTWYRSPVIDELKERFPITLQLAVMAILMAFVAAVPLGIISAVKQDTKIDYLSRIFALIGIAMPTFWIGILMVLHWRTGSAGCHPWATPTSGTTALPTSNSRSFRPWPWLFTTWPSPPGSPAPPCWRCCGKTTCGPPGPRASRSGL